MQQAAPKIAPRGDLTRILAEWASGFRETDLPASARRFLRLAVLDTVGVGLYGAGEEWTRMVRDWASGAMPAPGAPAATVWGEAEARLRPADAALVNGVAIHAFELDDFCQKIHPGAPIVPAALALAETSGASLAEVETAIALGYEVAIRTSRALDPNRARLRGWHLTGVCGPIGAAVACARLLGLDAEQTAWAIGLAATQSSGLFAFNADGAMSKRFHPGRAAQSGVMAAELAARGFTGPATVYEVEDGGFLGAFGDTTHPEALVDGLGRSWVLETTNFKPYACCGSVHAYVDCAKELRARLGGPPPADARVKAGVARVVDVQCGYDYVPGTVLNAQMSLRYCLAVALIDGEALPGQFAAERLSDPAVVALARRIELVGDAELDRLYPTHYPGWVEVTAGAAPERAFVLDPAGSYDNPGRETALLAKFDALIADLLPPERAARLRALLLEPGPADAGTLLAALRRE